MWTFTNIFNGITKAMSGTAAAAVPPTIEERRTSSAATMAGKKRKAEGEAERTDPPRRRKIGDPRMMTAAALTPSCFLQPGGYHAWQLPTAARKRKAENDEGRTRAVRRKVNESAASTAEDVTTTAILPEKTIGDVMHEKLPQELKDMIEGYVYCAGPTHHDIDIGYKPPSPLGVSRAVREKFATSHYTNSTFYSNAKQSVFAKWLVKLPPHHRAMILTVHWDMQGATEEEQAAHAAKQKDKKLTKNEVKAAKVKRRRERKMETSDQNQAVALRADKRKFYLMNHLAKRKKREGVEMLAKAVVKVNVRFEGMEEDVWVARPKEYFHGWKSERLRAAKAEAWKAEQALKIGGEGVVTDGGDGKAAEEHDEEL